MNNLISIYILDFYLKFQLLFFGSEKHNYHIYYFIGFSWIISNKSLCVIGIFWFFFFFFFFPLAFASLYPKEFGSSYYKFLKKNSSPDVYAEYFEKPFLISGTEVLNVNAHQDVLLFGLGRLLFFTFYFIFLGEVLIKKFRVAK